MATHDLISTRRLDDCACGAVAGRVQRSGRPGQAAVAGRHQQGRGLGLQHRTFCSFRSPAGNLPHRVAGSGDPGRAVLLLAILHRLVGLLIALKIAFLAMFTAGGAQGTAFVPPLLRKGRQNVGDQAATDRSAAPTDHDSRLAHPAAAIRSTLRARDAASLPWPVKSVASCHAPGHGYRTAGVAIGSRSLQPLSVRARETGPVPGQAWDDEYRHIVPAYPTLGTKVAALVLTRPSRRKLSSTSSLACRMSSAARRSSEVSSDIPSSDTVTSPRCSRPSAAHFAGQKPTGRGGAVRLDPKCHDAAGDQGNAVSRSLKQVDDCLLVRGQIAAGMTALGSPAGPAS